MKCGNEIRDDDIKQNHEVTENIPESTQVPVAQNLLSDSQVPPLPAHITEAMTQYIQAARAPRTRQAYREALERFLAWGGTVPASPELVAGYLAAHGATHKPATLSLWAAAIGMAHTSQHLENPCQSEPVRTTLKGIRRTHGSAQRRVAPTLRDDLLHWVRDLGECPQDRRDQALLLIGFAGALRRSELVALTVADVLFSEDGVTIRIRRSKTDPEQRGEMIGIPRARGRICPVQALKAWLTHYIYGDPRPPEETPVFRAVNRHGQIARQALTDHAVARILKRHCQKAGLDPTPYSGHSLRTGFITAAALKGDPGWKIRKQTRHKNDRMINDVYIREARLFVENPVDGMF